MRKLNRLIWIMAGVVIFTSCSKDNENIQLPDNREVNFNIGISQTRTVTNDKVTTFVEGDQIGIFGIQRGDTKLLNKNVEYTYNSESKWAAESSITFPITGESVNFYAYYPYGNHTETTFDFAVNADQSIENGYAKSDLLLAKNEESTVGDKAITLQFAHPMAMIEVKPELKEGSTFELQKVKLTAIRTASVDLVKQTVTVKSEEKAEEITLEKVAGGVYRAVIPVQKLKGRILEFVGIDTATALSVFLDYSLSTEKQLVANQITLFEIDL